MIISVTGIPSDFSIHRNDKMDINPFLERAKKLIKRFGEKK